MVTSSGEFKKLPAMDAPPPQPAPPADRKPNLSCWSERCPSSAVLCRYRSQAGLTVSQQVEWVCTLGT